MIRPPSLTLALALLLPAPALAEGLSIRLNSLLPQDGACRMIFALDSALPEDIEALAAEIVVLDRAGRVERLTLLEFQALPAGRPRVRSFDLPDLDCADVGGLVVNGLAACEGIDLNPRACERALVPGSDVPGVEVRG